MFPSGFPLLELLQEKIDDPIAASAFLLKENERDDERHNGAKDEKERWIHQGAVKRLMRVVVP